MKRKHRLKGLFIILVIIIGAIAMLSWLHSPDNDLLWKIKSKMLSPLEPAETNTGMIDNDNWKLILVGPNNPIPADFRVNLMELSNGHKVDERIYPYLQKMFDDARKEGIRPKISSSYRTSKQQQAELDQKTREFTNQGYPPDKALEIAKTWAAVPGTSEHQTGLAVDITSEDASVQAPDIVWQWLRKNAHKYGFIRRYPEEKTKITGISNEPWHFRYVGQEAAEEIYRRGICLEEYLEITHKGE